MNLPQASLQQVHKSPKERVRCRSRAVQEASIKVACGLDHISHNAQGARAFPPIIVRHLSVQKSLRSPGSDWSRPPMLLSRTSFFIITGNGIQNTLNMKYNTVQYPIMPPTQRKNNISLIIHCLCIKKF